MEPESWPVGALLVHLFQGDGLVFVVGNSPNSGLWELLSLSCMGQEEELTERSLFGSFVPEGSGAGLIIKSKGKLDN